jgi:hypothetical protein
MRTDEPDIVINGVRLSIGEAMTLRVQVASGLYHYADPNVLGADEHGRAMTQAYRRSLSNIQKIMLDL